MTYTSHTPHLDGLPDPALQPEFYAGVPLKRFLAWVVDVVLIGLVCLIVLPFTAFTALLFFPVFMLVVGFFYRWFTLAGGSATWGMRLFAIEIREADGGALSNGTAFAHTLGYCVSVGVAPLQLISVILMLLTDRGQGLTDHVLGTAAIRRPAR